MDITTANNPPIATGEARSNSRKRNRKKRGGYPNRRTLTKNEKIRFRNTLKHTRDTRVGPNTLISINPAAIEGETDAARKRRISKLVDYIRTIHIRNGHRCYFSAVFEMPIGGQLHAHCAVHIPAPVRPYIKNWVTKRGVWDDRPTQERYGVEIHACPYDRRIHDSYLTKETSFPCDPSEWKASPTNAFRPRPGLPFRGKRLKFSKDLHEQLTD